MPTTMSLIAKQTVGAGGVASVTFSDIPQTFTDLKVVATVRTNRSGQTDDDVVIRPNNNSSSATSRLLLNNGSSNASFTGTQIYMVAKGANATVSTFSNCEIYVPNYTSSNFKSFSADLTAENNTSGTNLQLSAQLWSNTSAITSLVFVPGTGPLFVEFTTFYLYGISNSTTTQNLTTPSAIGGDVITTDGSFWYHAFKYSGSFTPLKELTADVLVVAGGGGSGRTGGGGGAGGLRAFTAQALTSSTGYTCTVGAGGAGGTLDGGVAANGVNSSFAGFGFTTINATGGGGGSSYNNSTNSIGASGGSGGGGGTGDGANVTRTGGSGNAGGYSPVEGYAGGSAINSRGSGGGGGASAIGTNATSNTSPGVGGNGITSALTNTMGAATATGQLSSGNYYYAGGGTGSQLSGGPTAGGLGGGGAGGALSSGSKNGTANTGGGAGSNNDENGYQGGSGIIIVRYAV
jgi:hypothetical protein